MHAGADIPGVDEYLARFFWHAAHRFDRIHDQIKDHLLQLDPVSLDERYVIVELRPDRHAVVRCFSSSQPNHLANRLIDVERVLWGGSRLIKGTKSVDDFAGPAIVVDDILERIPHFNEVRWISFQEAQRSLRVGHCGGERLLYFMANRCRKLAYCGDTIVVGQRHLHLAQGVFSPFLVVDVGRVTDQFKDFSFGIAQDHGLTEVPAICPVPSPETFTINEVFGSWKQAQKIHFDEGGVFDQIARSRR